MRFVVSYDIVEDRARARVAKLLEGVLTRVQYSVFEGEAPEDRVATAVDRALGHIDAGTDSLRVYRLCQTCASKIDGYGRPASLSGGPVTVL